MSPTRTTKKSVTAALPVWMGDGTGSVFFCLHNRLLEITPALGRALLLARAANVAEYRVQVPVLTLAAIRTPFVRCEWPTDARFDDPEYMDGPARRSWYKRAFPATPFAGATPYLGGNGFNPATNWHGIWFQEASRLRVVKTEWEELRYTHAMLSIPMYRQTWSTGLSARAIHMIEYGCFHNTRGVQPTFVPEDPN